MGKRAYVLLLALLLLLTGCSVAELVKEDTAATALAVENSAEIPASTEPEKAQPSLLPGQVDIVTADEDKPVHNVPEEGSLSPSNKAVYHNKYGQELEKNITEWGTDLSDKIYVYPEYEIEGVLWPIADAVDYHEHGRTTLPYVMRYVPTEAMRETEEGLYYTVHDTDEHLRIFSFFYNYGDSEMMWYDRVGYCIYMAQTLNSGNFSGIQIGSSAEEVEAIDPKIVPLYLGEKYKTDPEYQEMLLISQKNGEVYFSLHLLQDGLLKITYEFDGTMFYVSDIYFSEDFLLTSRYNVYGEMMNICYAIDPLDYVVNSSLTE